MISRYTEPMNEAAKAIHLICCRSSPPERLNRKTRLDAEASMHSGNIRRKPHPRISSKGKPSRPNGLRAPPRPSRGPGVRKTMTLSSTITTPANQAKERHRLEGSLPSGNSSIR
jgi:hypothetical protein